MIPAKYFRLGLFVTALVLLAASDMQAQCAMCKAVAEGSAADEAGYAGGINKGIIYLMFIPYLLLIGLFTYFFRDRIMTFLRDINNIH